MAEKEAPVTMVEAERRAIVEALRYCHGSKEGAAYHLGIGISTLRRKMESFEIEPEEWAESKAATQAG